MTKIVLISAAPRTYFFKPWKCMKVNLEKNDLKKKNFQTDEVQIRNKSWRTRP
jgi:hypothetical protein